MNQFGSRPAWASVSGSFWTLEVSYVLPWSRRGASICLLVAAIFTRLWGGGGCIGKLVKPSSGLRLECERGGPAHSDFFFFLLKLFGFARAGEDEWSNSLSRSEKDLLCLDHRDSGGFFSVSCCCFSAAPTSCRAVVWGGGGVTNDGWHHLCHRLATGAPLKGKGASQVWQRVKRPHCLSLKGTEFSRSVSCNNTASLHNTATVLSPYTH